VGQGGREGMGVTNPPCPSMEQAENDKVVDLKRHAQQYANQQMTSDNTGLSYLESADIYKYDMLAIRRMIVQ
jgi:hypothetical protein